MTGRSSPSVLLFALPGAAAHPIGRILAEAEIAVTVVHDEDGALHATAAERFDLAIVVTGARRAGEVPESLRDGRPGLDILSMVEPAAGRWRGDTGGFEARRLVGCVRERLAGGVDADAVTRARNAAEFAIVEARIRCLYRRAEHAPGHDARSIAREIDTAIAERESLRRAGVALAR